eukprot:108765_1
MTQILTLRPDDYKKDDSRKYLPTYVAFHSCLLINGITPNIIIGLDNGSVIKYSLYNNKYKNIHLIYGHYYLKSPVEYFEYHSSPIIFIGFVNKLSQIFISIDNSGVVCVWFYDSKLWTEYGWFVPKFKYNIDLDSFMKTVTSQETKVLYDSTNSLIKQSIYNKLTNANIQKTHIFWKFKVKKDGEIDYKYLPKRINSNLQYIQETEPFDVDGLVYASANGNLLKHYQQKYKQIRLKGRLISAQFCSNCKDIIIAIVLEAYDKDKTCYKNTIIQFRLIRYNGLNDIENKCDSNETKNIISIDPFIVNIKQKHQNDWPIYNISSVLVPPCSDYLYILMNNELNVYSIYTSQKMMSMNGCISTNNPFCVSPNHECIIFGNQYQLNEEINNNQYMYFNNIIDQNKRTQISTFANAIVLKHCIRINRTNWKFRVQNHAFLEYNNDHYNCIKQ